MSSESKIIHVTITIDRDLHQAARAFARSYHKTTFSGQITKYFLDDMRNNDGAAAAAVKTKPKQ